MFARNTAKPASASAQSRGLQAQSAAPERPRTSWVDPQALMAIKNLELRARIVVEGFWKGIHRSPYHGFSVEFTEYRQYTPGDDPRYLDWRVFARTDRYYLKKFEDETNLRCHLLVDHSRSMGFQSLAWTKAEYATTLAATLAYFLSLQGDAVGVLAFDEQVRDYLPARNRPGHLRQLMLTLEQPVAGSGTNISGPLHRILEIVHKRGLMVLISDLLTPAAELEAHLTQLGACGHEVLLFQVLDPAELDFPFDRAVLFEDLESGRELYVDPPVARREYLKKLQRHQETLRGICHKLGMGLHQFATNRPLELALFDFLRWRMEKRKRTPHHRRAPNRA